MMLTLQTVPCAGRAILPVALSVFLEKQMFAVCAYRLAHDHDSNGTM